MPNFNPPTVGFHTNPERINRKGAPKKAWTWASLLTEAMEEELAATDGKKDKTKKFIIKRLIKMSVDGDIAAIKEIMNRMDGLPKQTMDVDVRTQELEDDIAETLDEYKT